MLPHNCNGLAGPLASRPAGSYSLTDRLAKVPDSAVLYPGHLYSPPETARSMGETRARNVVYKPSSVEQWMMMFGR